MNKVFLSGNLANDPEIKTYNEASFTVFCIAVQDGFGDKKKTYFFDCIASGKTGENIDKYFSKGKGIMVEGKLYVRKNDDNHSEIKISVYGFEFPPTSPDDKKSGGKKTSKKKQETTDPDDIPF